MISILDSEKFNQNLSFSVINHWQILQYGIMCLCLSSTYVKLERNTLEDQLTHSNVFYQTPNDLQYLFNIFFYSLHSSHKTDPNL